MATRKARRGARRWTRIGLIALLAGAALGWHYREPVRNKALTATAFSARIACSCRYVGGRSLAQCRSDLEAARRLVMLSEDEDAKSVTARIPVLASQTATWREGAGCVLERWQD